MLPFLNHSEEKPQSWKWSTDCSTAPSSGAEGPMLSLASVFYFCSSHHSVASFQVDWDIILFRMCMKDIYLWLVNNCCLRANRCRATQEQELVQRSEAPSRFWKKRHSTLSENSSTRLGCADYSLSFIRNLTGVYSESVSVPWLRLKERTSSHTLGDIKTTLKTHIYLAESYRSKNFPQKCQNARTMPLIQLYTDQLSLRIY